MTSVSSSLNPSYFFGLKNDIANNLIFMEENIVVFISGNVGVIYYLDTKTQKLFFPSDSCENITSISVPPTRRVISICEKTKKGPIISLFEFPSLKRKKPLVVNDSVLLPFQFSDFSSDSRYLVAQEASPNYNIYIFNWEKGRLIGSYQPSIDTSKSINYLKFHLTDPSILVNCGYSTLNFYRLNEGNIKPMPLNTFKKELGNILCYAYVSEKRCIICNEGGELILFENTGSCIELRSYLPLPPNSFSAIYSIISTSKGFIIGTSDSTIRIYEESDDATEFYHIYRTVKGKSNSYIKSLSLSPSEDMLLCNTSSCEVLQLSLGNIDILKPEEIKLDCILGPFHSSNSSGSYMINSLSISLRKPIIITGGVDRTIRVWDYLKHTSDLYCKYDEDIHSVAIHPSGLFGAVAFISRIKLITLLSNTILHYFEFPVKGCNLIQYSSGGHRIAASNQSNAIVIIDIYYCQIIYELPGHIGRIDSIEWVNHDQYLFSACRGGNIIQWDMLTGMKINEYRNKMLCWNSISPKFDGSIVYASGYKLENDSTTVLCVIEFPSTFTSLPTLKQESELTGYRVGDMVYSNFNQTLYTSQGNPEKPGSICGIKFPIGELPTQVFCHSSRGIKMVLTYDEKTLISAGEDGSIGIFQVKSSLRGIRENRVAFSDEVLVQEKDIEQQELLLKSLEEKIAEFTLKNEKQLKDKEKTYEMNLSDVKRDYESTVETEMRNIEDITRDIDILHGNCDQKLSKLKSDYEQEVIELESSQKSKIDAEIKRYNLLCEERDKLNAANDKENQILLNSHARHKEELVKKYTEELNIENDECNKLIELKEAAIQNRKNIENDLEVDCDSEIYRMNKLTQQKMQNEISQQNELSNDTQQLVTTLNSMKDSKLDYEKQKELLKKNEIKKCTNIRGLEKDIIGHKKEIKEREDTIADKDKRIYELNRKNQELEKFKFVLDYKIKELKRQIKPRQEQITRLKQQILEMDQELEQYHRSNASLDLMIGELKMKSFGMKNDLNNQKKLYSDALGVVERFRNDLHGTYQKINDHKHLKTAVTHLFSKYVREYDKEGSQSDTQIQEEYNRRREYLETNVNSIKQKISKETQNGHIDKLRLMRENSLLTQEINNLRKEMRMIKQSEKASRYELLKQMSQEAENNESNENKKIIDMQQSLIYQLIQKLQSLGGVLDIPPPTFQSYQDTLPQSNQFEVNTITSRRSAKL